MLKHVLFDLRLFDDGDRGRSQKGLLWLLEALTQWNTIYLQDNPKTPLIYQSGIKYLLPEQFVQAEMPQLVILREAVARAGITDPKALTALEELGNQCGSGEHFRDVPAILENGGGDCDNLACFRAAELRVHGIAAMPYITWRKRADGGMTYHAIVQWPDGTSEDPSLILGMGGEARAADRQEELRKNAERKENMKGSTQSEVLGSSGVEPFDKEGTYYRNDTVDVDGTCWVALEDVAPPFLYPYIIPGDQPGGSNRKWKKAESVLGAGDPGFGQGIYYQPSYWADDFYEGFDPTPPNAYFSDPHYKNGLVTPGPLQVPTLWQDVDDDLVGHGGGHHGGGHHGGGRGRGFGPGYWGYGYDDDYDLSPTIVVVNNPAAEPGDEDDVLGFNEDERTSRFLKRHRARNR